ncbi:glutamate racemase [Acaricomes phytoseiuli]|uniref:glutamate racemase n=1 Tax=Acaricomes phytoseiuli TaxID=291968 RepID=UPI0003670BB4|nr:glutamate racemase [Acaricomes phytoseiuli]MCW1248746.1 glutamate racemase [Acaricomes phytoseiuli]
MSGADAQSPLGIFDSGVGGLTVARAVFDQLPHEAVFYVGDTANAPYGPLPIAEVRANALGVMDELVDAGVKLLVIACNSASAAVLADARERYTRRQGIPVVEVIQPAVRRAMAATRNRKIGVIGTQATIGSRVYQDLFGIAGNLEVTAAACPDFVPFVEAGVTSGPELLKTAQEYLEPLKAAEVDTVVLGCTHYPLLAAAISYVMGDQVTLVSSAEETAKDVYKALVGHGLERTQGWRPQHRFVATGDAGAFEALARRFLGPEVTSVEHAAHVSAHYPTGSLTRITPELLTAAQSGQRGRGDSGSGIDLAELAEQE